MDYSRIRSAFYAAMSVLVPIAMYIKQQGGLDAVNVWDMIIFFGATFGATTAGYHIPSRLSDPDKSQKNVTLAAAIQRLEQEPPTTIEKIAKRAGGNNGGKV